MPINAALEIRRVKLSSLKPAPYNPREIAPEAMAALEKSLERFGVVEPIIWNERTGHVVGGHQRQKILESANVDETDVVVIDISESEEKALNIALNSPLINGTFTADLDGLLEELASAQPVLFEELQLGGLFQTEVNFDPTAAWDGMPRYTSEDLGAFRTIHVHFANQEAVDEFAKLLERNVGGVRSMWFPPAEIGHFADKQYENKS
jgi:hypothetical protein